ncbi:outer membrane beta-barrel protein [Fluviicola chungangensis]|uniref:Porin family protein n=1 Tax=Fluviicola chungangensis TaxID=2597671 RepID=A0A556MNV3_9FLAO|nr:outer membrane beta-barrel protein [Fluviicola chungangensis]TSJ41634.1 porin family protein [Fluviicola chungangensis]
MKYSDRHISDEELDQLFRDAHASEGQEALFVPEFWSEMEAMLPAERSKKRGFYWIPLASVLVLIGIVWFYPSNPAQIDRLEQKQAKQEDKSELIQTGGPQRNETSVVAENSTVGIAPAPEAVLAGPKVKTTLKTRKRTNTDSAANDRRHIGSDDRASFSDRTPNKQESGEERTKEISGLAPDSRNELDSIKLEVRFELVPHEEITGLPEKGSNESNEWYVEAGPTIGQSPYLSPDQKRNVVSGAVLGGGYTKRIDNAFVSFGLQARLEGFGGLEYRETNFSPNIVRTVTVKQLYSLEVPLRFGYTFRRSEMSLGVVPGVQLFIHGQERITENQIVERQNSFTGKVEHSNSLTMEFGLQYYYNFNSKWSVGAKVNADVLRPFHTDYYLGKSTGLPVNGQILLRRSFRK